VSLLTPWSLLWLAAAAAIAGLYLLKPRSRRVEVSSTWLWQGALREQSARTPIQWLKRHLLLLLQLLAALAGVFALARPAFTREVPVGRTIVIAVDTSAAMLATDGDPAILAAAGLAPPAAGGVTRLDEARARVLQVLNLLERGDRAIILALADRAEVVAQGAIPGDLESLRRVARRLQVAPADLNLAQGLELAGSLTRSARIGQIVLITGGAAEVDESILAHRPPAAIETVLVGRGDSENQAITALEARRSAGGDLEVFARIRNYGDQPASGTLRIKVDGQAFGEVPLELAPRQAQELVLAEFPPRASLIEATFVRRDLLALDNVATAAAVVPPVRKVLVVGGRSEQLERALRAVPGVELAKTDPQRYDPRGGYDVYVFEGWFPPSPPPGHWILIDPPLKGAPVRVTGTLGRRTEGGREVNDAQIARVMPSPLLRGVDLTGVGVSEAKKVALPEWAEEVVSAREGPLLFLGYPRPYRAVVFAFDLRATNLFGRVAFPVLVANVINWLTGDLPTGMGADVAAGRFTPGDALLIQPLPRATAVQIETPRKRYRFDGHQPVRFVDTAFPGAYTVTQFAGAEEIARRVYIASVLRPGHEGAVADLKPRDLVGQLETIGGPQPAMIQLGPGKELAHAEWWRVLAVAALMALFVEWWWFHR
jgi:hypothetical protein